MIWIVVGLSIIIGPMVAVIGIVIYEMYFDRPITKEELEEIMKKLAAKRRIK